MDSRTKEKMLLVVLIYIAVSVAMIGHLTDPLVTLVLIIFSPYIGIGLICFGFFLSCWKD